jgi:tetratricopeptide (TPR) repeat protein
VSFTLNRLGLSLEGEGRYADAETAYRRALAIDEARAGPDSAALLALLNNLSRICDKDGKKREAAALRKQWEEIIARLGIHRDWFVAF